MKAPPKIPALLLLLCSFLVPALFVSAESVDELIKKGDQHAQNYEEEKALEYYLAAARQDLKNAHVQVAISREYRHLMSDSRGKKDKLRYAKIALEHAQKAAKLGPSDTEAQLAQAITYGKLLPLINDSGDKLKISRRIKAAVDRAIALDAKNDTAWHILGRWHRGFAEISGAKRLLGGLVHGDIPKSSYADAATCFRKALKIEPNRLMHYVELGCIYCAMGKNSEAEKHLKRGLAMSETEKDDPETKRHARAVLKSL